MSVSARVSRAASSRPLSPREDAVKLNLDAFVSSATLKIIEQEWERSKSPLNCPATAGVRCSADAGAAQPDYGGLQEGNLPGALDATQRAATREVGGGCGGGDGRAEAKVKDPLSMRINMETEMLGSGADSQHHFAFEHDSACGSDTDSLSPVPPVGCISGNMKSQLSMKNHRKLATDFHSTMLL